MKATEQYFPVVLFVMLYTVVPTFEFVDNILKCENSNKLLSTAVIFPWSCLLCYEVDLNFELVYEILKCNFCMKALTFN